MRRFKDQVFSSIILKSGSEAEIRAIEPDFIQKFKCSLNSDFNTLRPTKNRPASQGEKHPQSVLTEKEVITILDLYHDKSNKTTYKKLGEQFGVNPTAIGKIVRGEKWKHIDRSRWINK